MKRQQGSAWDSGLTHKLREWTLAANNGMSSEAIQIINKDNRCGFLTKIEIYMQSIEN